MRSRLVLGVMILATTLHAVAASHRSRALASSAAAASPTPFTASFSGALNATESSGFLHFMLPPSVPGSTALTPTPALTGKLTFTLTPAAAGCDYALCSTRLVQAPEDGDGESWRTSQPPLCEAYWNSSSMASPFVAAITPGVNHFAVFARVANALQGAKHGRRSLLSAHQRESSGSSDSSSSSDSSNSHSKLAAIGTTCAFTLALSGDACPAGTFGTNCESVPSTSLSSPFLSATLPASNPDAVAYFAVHPDSIYARSMLIDVRSSSDNLTAFLHEGDLPALSGSPIDPIRDFNVTSSYSEGTAPAAYDVQAQLTLPAPAYRIDPALQSARYFLGVTRSAAAKQDPHDSTLSVLVESERLCPSGTHGAACEFFVDLFLSPFDLTALGVDQIRSSAFGWSADRQSLWYYFGLVFLDVTPANFSVGISAKEGQLVPPLYLRLGAPPTLDHFDMKFDTVNPGQQVRFYESGQTLTHDAVWFGGINVPLSYPRMGDVLLFINTDCPGTSTKVDPNTGLKSTTECNGRGACLRDIHQCLCFDRYSGADCLGVDTTLGLSAGARAIIILLTIAGTVAFGFCLCWWFAGGMARRSGIGANAGYGHHLDEGGAGGGGGGRAAAAAPPGRQPMGRI